MTEPLEPLDLGAARTLPFSARSHLVSIERFRPPASPGASVGAFLDSLPDFLGARALRDLASEIAHRHRAGAEIVFAMGAHVVKVGCGPVICDLMERGIVTAIAVNGAFAIHDWEIAFAGETSERVAETIRDGRFGWVRETAEAMAQAARRGAGGEGFGRAVGRAALALPHARHSVLATAARLGLPATVHVALGTDTVHMHPALDWAQLGRACEIDFRLAAAVVARLEGGLWANVGSAVLLPEVFLKLVSIARNLGHGLDDVVAANLDMQRHYRTEANVIGRPVRRGIAVIGHHEINLPLLRMAVLAALGEDTP
ncbi:MAG: hypothetical protein D6776_06940 [Planctomycetota bacterium]|nr:MAG: hypothetical protein D6776_06940 [Planctomycetota bacterium]